MGGTIAEFFIILFQIQNSVNEKIGNIKSKRIANQRSFYRFDQSENTIFVNKIQKYAQNTNQIRKIHKLHSQLTFV